jgi:peptidoglycan hydrolase CwlO-like protein
MSKMQDKFRGLMPLFTVIMMLVMLMFVFYAIFNAGLNSRSIDKINTNLNQLDKKFDLRKIENDQLNFKLEEYERKLDSIDREIDFVQGNILTVKKNGKETIVRISNYDADELERYFAERYKKTK